MARRRSRNRNRSRAEDIHIELPGQVALQLRVPEPMTPSDFPVQLIFHAVRRNDYATLVKLTDATGSVTFSKDEILDDAKTLVSLYPQDYFEIQTNVNKKVTAVLMGTRDIEWAQVALELHQEKGRYPEAYAQTLERALAKLGKLGDVVPELSVVGETDEYEVTCRLDTQYVPEPTYEAIHYEFATEGLRPPGM